MIKIRICMLLVGLFIVVVNIVPLVLVIVIAVIGVEAMREYGHTLLPHVIHTYEVCMLLLRLSVLIAYLIDIIVLSLWTELTMRLRIEWAVVLLLMNAAAMPFFAFSWVRRKLTLQSSTAEEEKARESGQKLYDFR